VSWEGVGAQVGIAKKGEGRKEGRSNENVLVGRDAAGSEIKIS